MIAAPNDLNVLDGQTDRRTLLWHAITALCEASHGKTERQNIGTADIVGIAKVPITYRFKKTQSTHKNKNKNKIYIAP